MMVVLGITSFFITLPILLSQDFNERYLISSCLELVTTCVPPALPAVLACGIVFALDRLKKHKIYCIAPPRINLAGTVQTFVFDKTGTLTEEGLSVLGVRPSTTLNIEGQIEEEITFKPFLANAEHLAPQLNHWQFSENSELYRSQKTTLFLESLASCTAITYVNKDLVGDPMDVKMF